MCGSYYYITLHVTTLVVIIILTPLRHGKLNYLRHVLTSPPLSLERLYKLFKTVGYILTWCLNLTTASLHFILFTSQTNLCFPLSTQFGFVQTTFKCFQSIFWKYRNDLSKIKFPRQAHPLMIIEINNEFWVSMLNKGERCTQTNT